MKLKTILITLSLILAATLHAADRKLVMIAGPAKWSFG